MDESHKLGENVQLSGFRELDSSTKDVLHKSIGSHVRRISELCKKMNNLHITLKPIHQREKSEKYEVHAKLNNDGKIFAAEAVDRNLFVAVDDALRRLTSELD